MSVDWLVNFDCRPKRDLSPLGIYRRQQVLERFETVSAMTRRACPPGGITAIELDFFEITPQGQPLIRTISASDVSDLSGTLEQYGKECASCPANVRSAAFGCFGSVRFPVTGNADHWLISNLPEHMTSPAGSMLVNVMTRLGCDGSELRWMRSSGGRYFELGESPRRSWRLPRGSFSLDADALYEAMFLTSGTVGIAPYHGLLLCYLVGALDEVSLPRFVSTQGELIPTGFRFEPGIEREPSIRDLKMFLLALFRAGRMGMTLSIRMPRRPA